jgi:DNA polymerase
MHEQLRHQYLQAMGIQLWESREQIIQIEAGPKPVPVAEQPPAPNDVPTAEQAEVGSAVVPVFEDWQSLTSAIQNCTQCAFSESRTNVVVGSGNQQADVLFIGEAPGAEEDKAGQPFVGSAGQLLTEMLKAIGFERQQVYIMNMLKCRPPGNRDPEASEIAACSTYLQQQIQWIQPRIIVALGRIAAQQLLKSHQNLGALRGKMHQLPDSQIPVMATYHPAYLLRSPSQKRKSWEDLCALMNFLEDDVST